MLHIVADDLGLHPSVNKGIIAGLRGGFITEASLMANGEAFLDAIREMDETSMNIGIHLVLVEEPWLTTGRRIAKNYKFFLARYCLGQVGSEDIEREFEAQIRKMENASIKPAFINGHQHLHLFPGLIDVVVRVAVRHGIERIRIVHEPQTRGGWLRRTQLIILEILSRFAKRKIEGAGLRYNEAFIGFLSAGHLHKEDISVARKLAQINPDAIIELGCHPGYESESLRTKYGHWGYHWEAELNLLKDDHMRSMA
ncbi:MAG TPA: ChbG/HpnK family deacetylase [Candidatus Paceibacterota bacterium]|nr:ChbG/HpnK family deacetylase [Candidatus Paceibacterota bacterium]